MSSDCLHEKRSTIACGKMVFVLCEFCGAWRWSDDNGFPREPWHEPPALAALRERKDREIAELKKELIGELQSLKVLASEGGHRATLQHCSDRLRELGG